MKAKINLAFFIVVLASLFAFISLYEMTIDNPAPYNLECAGKMLKKKDVIAISNINRVPGADTLLFHFENSKPFMPKNLGYLFYDKKTNEYVLKNDSCIYNAYNLPAKNYFLPFCHTMDRAGKYYGVNEVVNERNLLIGIKYNSPAGTSRDRVRLKLIKFDGKDFISFKDNGILTTYPVKYGTDTFDVFLNKPIQSQTKFLFNFTNTTNDVAKFSIVTNTSIFDVSYRVYNEKGSIILTSSEPLFLVNDFIFKVSPKYSIILILAVFVFILIISGVSFYFIYKAKNINSPVIISTLLIRVLFNCISLLTIPIFLIAVHYDLSRWWFLVFVAGLNLFYFFNKTSLHRLSLKKYERFSNLISIIIVLATLVVWQVTRDEKVCGIPVLHVQKFLLLALVFVLQHYSKKYKINNLVKNSILLGYTFVVSFLFTNDIGSFIYISLAIILIEVIKGNIKPIIPILFVVGFIGLIYLGYQSYPEMFAEKGYRLVANYTSPSSDHLIYANESDRETYSSFSYNLRNAFSFNTPMFGNVNIPVYMKSTSFSDFAFHWSFMLGGYFFLVLFFITLIFLSNELLLLLFVSFRKIQIDDELIYSFMSNSESELARFLLAVTIVQIIYPSLSNLGITPITGQSIPLLSISLWEVFFIAVLFFFLESLFTSRKYIASKSSDEKKIVGFKNLKEGLNFSVITFVLILIAALVFRIYSLRNLLPEMQWEKQNKEYAYNEHIPATSDKKGLIDYSMKLFSTENYTNIPSKEKPLLRELATRYYSGKSFNEFVFETRSFYNSADKMYNQTCTDSVLALKKILFSGNSHPFGNVFLLSQMVNDKPFSTVSNSYYSGIPLYAKSINRDLRAECSKVLEDHLNKIGIKNNIGSIVIVDNATGSIIANSTYPLIANVNSNEIPYLPGSVKKLLVAYAALQVDASVKYEKFNNRSFQEFIEHSDDLYAATLLRNLLSTKSKELNDLLINDFDLPLISITNNSYLGEMPDSSFLYKPLTKMNKIYRLAIGQEKPYSFLEVMTWYARFAAGVKLHLNYSQNNQKFGKMSLSDENMQFLKACFHSVLLGTASKVAKSLTDNGIDLNSIVGCKTGTPERQDGKGNTSSSFILFTNNYTVGVMMKGLIPHNVENVAAKDLFTTLIPILRKYSML